MKKIIAMAIAAFFFTTGLHAQIRRIQDSSFEKQKNVHRKTMIKDNWNNLNLTADQKQKMKENQENLKSQRQAIQNDATLTPEQKKSKLMDLQKASREKTNALLTAEQKATLKASQKEKGYEKGMKGQKRMKGEKGMKHDRDMKGLNLTQDQQTKMKELRPKMQSESMAIKNNSSLTEEQKKQQMQELRKNHKEQMNQLLTPEQKLKMKNHQGKMKNKDAN
jgi:Spy/CpxP family protein refolding chaperone